MRPLESGRVCNRALQRLWKKMLTLLLPVNSSSNAGHLGATNHRAVVFLKRMENLCKETGEEVIS